MIPRIGRRDPSSTVRRGRSKQIEKDAMNTTSATARSVSAARSSWIDHRREPRPGGSWVDRRSQPETFPGMGITVTVLPGQTIVVEGDPIEHCFRIVSGAVRLYNAIADGRRQVIDFLAAGECFGFLGTGRHAYSVEAIAPTTLIRHPRPNLDATLQRSTELARRMLDLACAELERAQRQMLLLGRKSAEEKVASFLLTLAERSGERHGRAIGLHLPMSRQDMADYLGLTIETVSRTVSRLKRDGLIRLLTPQHVLLVRLDDLRALAEGGA